MSTWNFGFFMVTISWRFLSSFMFCMSLSSVISASQLFMADEKMRLCVGLCFHVLGGFLLFRCILGSDAFGNSFRRY